MRILLSLKEKFLTVIETDKVTIVEKTISFCDSEGACYKASSEFLNGNDIIRLYTDGLLNLLEAEVTITENQSLEEENHSFFEEPGIINPPCAIVDIMDDSNDIFIYDVHEIVNVFGDDVDGKCDRYHYVKNDNNIAIDENIIVTFQKEEFQYPKPFPSIEAALEYLDENGYGR